MTTPPYLDPRQGLVRGVRAAVLTVPAVGGAALAHSLADGCGSLLAMTAAAGLCWPAAVALLRGRRRLPALIAWLVGAQVVTHLLLEWMCPDVTSGRMGLLDHLLMGLSPAMLSVHVGAVLVTAVLLDRADAGLWAADALLRAGIRALRVLAGRTRPVLPEPVWRGTSFVSRPVRLHGLWEAAPLVRRGPPALLAH
ncbi:MAG: hypothetical protein JWM02_2769 [Frankiales bacterium]|nr:hypothetical protein [Frankiales bacterium]